MTSTQNMNTDDDEHFERMASIIDGWFASDFDKYEDYIESESESETEPDSKTDEESQEPIIVPTVPKAQPAEEHQLTEYVQSYKKMGFVPIPFKEMKLKGDTKHYYGLPMGWNKLTINDPTLLKPEDSCLCILTGKPSGITVMDFDSEMLYLKVLEEHPELANSYTVKTRRGYHVYFKYNPHLKGITDVCDMCPKGLDIKNDGGHCTTEPSTYDDTMYQHYNGDEIIDIPNYILDLLNESAFKNTSTKSEEEVIKEEKKHEEIDIESKMKIVDLIDVNPFLDDYNSWRRIVFAMKKEGLPREFAQKISKKSNTFTPAGFDNHWDGAPVDITVNLGTLIRYAQKSNKNECNDLLKKARQSNKKNKEVIDGFEEKAKQFEALGNGKLRNGNYVTTGENGYPIIINKKEMFNRYEHLSYEVITDGKKAMVPFIKPWMYGNENIKLYDGADVFPPGATVPNNYVNLWIPFDMELIDEYTPVPEVIDFMTNHLRIMCDNEENIYEHLNTWMAHILHRPSVKTKQMPIIIAKQGAGKTSVVELIKAMIGKEKVVDVSDPKTVCGGDFNGPLMNSYIVHMSELSKSKIDIDKLKHIISEPTISIVKKGKDPFSITSRHNLIAPTNNNDPVPTPGDDRRLLITRASDELIGNVDYFDKFYKFINDPNAMKTLYEYYKTVTIPDDFNKLKPPTTKHHQELKEMNRSPIASWLEQFIIEEMDSCNEDTKEYSNTVLYQKFKSWKEANGVNYEISAQQFNMRIHSLRLNGVTTKKTKKCNLKVINFADALESIETCV